MSDLQDLIARNAVMAFNEGYRQGAREQKEKIMLLAQKATAHGAPLIETDRIGDYVYLVDLLDYMKDDDDQKAN